MSGGIDSSAVCIMLQEQGYEVVGVTMRTWDVRPISAHPARNSRTKCSKHRLLLPDWELSTTLPTYAKSSVR